MGLAFCLSAALVASLASFSVARLRFSWFVGVHLGGYANAIGVTSRLHDTGAREVHGREGRRQEVYVPGLTADAVALRKTSKLER